MIILAALQWIIGPLLAYKFYPDDEFYYMAVELHEYMSFVVPATAAFALGMYLPFWRKEYSEKFYLYQIQLFASKYKNVDILLIILGIVSELLIDFVPGSLKFVFFLFSGMRFIGLYFLLLSSRKYKKIYVVVVIGWLFISSIQESLFHELLLWLGFLLLIMAFIKNPGIGKKIVYLMSILLLAVVIQTVKYSFRQALIEGSGQRINLFVETVQSHVVEGDRLMSESNLASMVTRINQGWIIARIMSWTPSREPFAEGETIIEAVKSSVMPRFLFPDKLQAGGRNYFARFTGKYLSDQTAMGLGLLGEAYANFGIFGGIVFMLSIGVFYNFIVHKIYKVARRHASIIFFIPIIFLQVVKAETDFSVILNHLIKATVIVWFIFWSFNKFLKIRI
jgi:hypothetical protein